MATIFKVELIQTMRRFNLSVLLLVSAGHAADPSLPITPAPVTSKAVQTVIEPKIPEKKFTLPALPPRVSLLSRQEIQVTHSTAEIVAQLQRAARDVRLVEVWSLDPSVTPDQEKERKSRPYPFHCFHSLGREELKNREEIQKLLHSVMLAIANGPEETNECFEPRHGLRIFHEKGLIDLVLCYSCLQGVLYDGKVERWFSTSGDPEVGFDVLFEKLALKKAK